MLPRHSPILFLTLGILLFPMSAHASSNALNESLTFTNSVLTPSGSNEPGVTVGLDGTMLVDALAYFDGGPGTRIWKGPFGSEPSYQGLADTSIGKALGGADASADLGSTGTLHLTTLVFFLNPAFSSTVLPHRIVTQTGISAITCPHADTSENFAHCSTQLIDITQADRPWITSDGPQVYISYHDSGASGQIHVQRSDDDGFTWQRVGDPIVGQGAGTANGTVNNFLGPIIADPHTHNVYEIYDSGIAGPLKTGSINRNNIYVSRSTDTGRNWESVLVYSAPDGTNLDNALPALTVDPDNGVVFATWSDTRDVFFSESLDEGSTWSAAEAVNVYPATTAIFPWVAARNGVLDLVYYGTNSSSNMDSSGIWNVYLAQSSSSGTGFVQSIVTNSPNHIGPICGRGGSCPFGSRNLLDLFQVAIDPENGLAVIVYADDAVPNSGFCCITNVAVAYQNA